MNKQELVFAKLVEIATAYFSEGKYVVCGALVDFINANSLCSPENAAVLAVAVWNEVSEKQKPFLPGDLVINFGAVCVVEGYNNGDCLLKIVLCTKDGIVQGGHGQRYCAPPKNCRLVTNADNVRLKHFAE